MNKISWWYQCQSPGFDTVPYMVLQLQFFSYHWGKLGVIYKASLYYFFKNAVMSIKILVKSVSGHEQSCRKEGQIRGTITVK